MSTAGEWARRIVAMPLMIGALILILASVAFAYTAMLLNKVVIALIGPDIPTDLVAPVTEHFKPRLEKERLRLVEAQRHLRVVRDERDGD